MDCFATLAMTRIDFQEQQKSLPSFATAGHFYATQRLPEQFEPETALEAL